MGRRMAWARQLRRNKWNHFRIVLTMLDNERRNMNRALNKLTHLSAANFYLSAVYRNSINPLAENKAWRRALFNVLSWMPSIYRSSSCARAVWLDCNKSRISVNVAKRNQLLQFDTNKIEAFLIFHSPWTSVFLHILRDGVVYSQFHKVFRHSQHQQIALIYYFCTLTKS